MADRYGNVLISPAVVVLARIITDVDVAKNIANDWKLSRADGNLLVEVIDLKTKEQSLPQLYTARDIQLWYFTGDVSLNAAATLFLATDRNEEFRKIAYWDIPVFPLNGDDVIGAFPGLKGPEIGKKIKYLKFIWARNKYKLPDNWMIDNLIGVGCHDS